MASIMAPDTRFACALGCALLAVSAAASSDIPMPSTYTTLPTDYSLSFDEARSTDAFSVFKMSVANGLGTLESGFAASDDPRLRPLTRLDSAWNWTLPLIGLPMRVGDGVSSVGFWDQPARIGGIQLGSMQPSVPPVVVPPAVAIPEDTMGLNPAAPSRYGDRLRSVVQFQKPVLETAGQGDFSVESGWVRENFELRSADYGPWLTSGTYRYGVNTATTVDGEVAQVAGQQSVVGVGILEGLGSLGLVSAKVASSHDPDGAGWLARMGYDFSHDDLSIALRSHIQSPGFQDVGDTSLVEPFRTRTLASARVDLGPLGKVSLASAAETYTDDSHREIVALSHAMPFGSGGIVSTAAAYSPGQLGNSALLLSFTYPFGDLDGRSHPVSTAINSALDRTIVDAFGQTRLPATGREDK
jgi:outer membrane usher protein